MRLQELPSDIHRIIIDYLMDDFKELHKRMMAPTLAILSRTKYPCRICMRNTLLDTLCRLCISRVCSILSEHSPGPLYQYGQLLYMPVPPEVSVDRVLDYMKFLCALYHLDFNWQVATTPFLPEGLVHVPGNVLILHLHRRTSLEHFYFRKPAMELPRWTCVLGHVLEFQHLPDSPSFPSFRSLVDEDVQRMRSLNALFPR